MCTVIPKYCHVKWMLLYFTFWDIYYTIGTPATSQWPLTSYHEWKWIVLITRKKPGNRDHRYKWQLLHVTPEMNRGKLNHCHSSDCMTLVPLSAAFTQFYCTSDMQCCLLLGLYKNYCLGSYWWKLSHFAGAVTVKFRRFSYFKSVCQYSPASAMTWETGVLFLCVHIYAPAAVDLSWNRWQCSCNYLIGFCSYTSSVHTSRSYLKLHMDTGPFFEQL
jgi:hypothetical protein